MKIIGKKIKWQAPTDVSVKSHVVYLVKESQTLDYFSPSVEVPMPSVELVLPAGFDMAEETNYKIGLTSKDVAGNESDMAVIQRPFDFNPPVVPVGLDVVDL